MFFTTQRQDFFKPLTSKYREQIAQCLCLLYQRLYSSDADYGHALTRETAIDIFEEALVRAPILEGEEGDDSPARFKSVREQASWVLKQLLEYGWMEKQVDGATLISSYAFTRLGRLFTQPLIESDAATIRTRNRNTRNTLNALEAFISRGEAYDLVDAFEYSERIVTDFTDVIAELEERKRQLVQEVESQQLVQQATDQFFEFMEKRFKPDVAVRLSADSVEKHRDKIYDAIEYIRKKTSKEFKHQTELQLRRIIPEFTEAGRSSLWLVLDTIERRMARASETMLPALRKALHSFTKRADIIIRQLSYLNYQQQSDILTASKKLAELPEEKQDSLLDAIGDQLSALRVQLIDPAKIKWTERKHQPIVRALYAEPQPLDKAAQRDLLIQQLLEQAFGVDHSSIRNYVQKAFRNSNKIYTRHLHVDTAKDLLAMAHAIEVASVNHASSDFEFRVEFTGETDRSDYYDVLDEFTIELIDKKNV